MSGEAGARLQSTYYSIYYASGMMVSIEEPPYIEGEEQRNYTAEYFESENKVYENKLDKLKNKLDKLFMNFIEGEQLPIVPYDQNSHFSLVAIVEDKNDQVVDTRAEQELINWINQQSKPKLFISFSSHTAKFRRIELSFTVSKRITRTQLDGIQKEVLDLFN